MRRHSTFCILLSALCVLFLSLPIHAAYVNVTDLAREHGLEYKDMSLGAGHGCKLTGNGREVILFDGMRTALVNNAAVTLPAPVQWTGSALMVPGDVAALFAPGLSISSAPAEASAPDRLTSSASLDVPDKLNKDATVVIDPGHGGNDPGTHGGGMVEKDLNLDVSKRVARYLQEHGVKVVMTRSRDVAVDLPDRTDLANRINPDLFLSIHTNWMPVSSLRGAMLLHPTEGVQYRAAARNGRPAPLDAEAIGAGGAFSAAVRQVAAIAAYKSYRASSIEAAYRLQAALDPITGLYESTGVMESPRNLHILRETHCPAVIVEMDFLSNSVSAKKLATSAYRAQIAEAIGKAALSYLVSATDQ